ncbi:DJ-1/PfpI family protein [Flavobacterium sp.]|uniref:DJ-1/PfpI family protein n=1 Tax=Flavobacterium sp. TaxID=239 RepID=UPI00286CE4D3|nr:DJ-1/PfpI family protein [Flavobacterium sp.]
MKIKKRFWALVPVMMISCLLYTACKPYREFASIPVYKGAVKHDLKPTAYDKSKKTIVIIANNEGTEIFDLMAPYYLFNATEKANVYVVAEKKQPIVLLKGLFIYPNTTFKELDSLGIQPDVVVIPAMIKVFADAKSPMITWIKDKSRNNSKILSVCAGSLVGAATGLYDGKPLTTHASQFEESKAFFKNPHWIQNVSVTKTDNLYSTAGVSNAVEGSLTIINETFGKETFQKIMRDIHYPQNEIKLEHKSIEVKTSHKFTIANKLIFRKNKKVGVLLQEGCNEMMLAAVIDTYHRTFPSSLETIAANGLPVTSKYGLTIIPTSTLKEKELDELHILSPDKLSDADNEMFKGIPVIKYNQTENQYIINKCLQRIKEQYGHKFENITKLLLDYN